jgi:uncharacterized protein YjbI with pentapeptide repeats
MVEPRTYSGNGHTANIADPTCITSAECLSLARCGVDAWNQWRDEFPGEPIREVNLASISGVDSTNESIDFSGFKFDGVDFTYAVLGRRQKFRHCYFGRANFSNSKFVHFGYFEDSVFSTSDFDGVEFFKFVNFNAALLGGTAGFRNCKFHEEAFFGDACATGDLPFNSSIFSKEVHFSGVTFLDQVNFLCCEFYKDAIFDGRSILALQQTFRKPPFLHSWGEIEKLLQINGGAPDQFFELSFDGSLFLGRVSFRGRNFTSRASFDIGRRFMEARTRSIDGKETVEEVCDLLPVRFAKPPEFFDCKLCQQVSFDHTRFPPPLGEPEAARCYRVLKQAFAAHQSTREEQRFFRLEMAEEAGMAWSLKGLLSTRWAERSQKQKTELPPARLLYKLYAVFSGWGFSTARPAGLFFAALLVSAGCYATQADLTWCGAEEVVCTMSAPLLQFTLGQALPGFEKYAEPATKALLVRVRACGLY